MKRAKYFHYSAGHYHHGVIGCAFGTRTAYAAASPSHLLPRAIALPAYTDHMTGDVVVAVATK